jgi:hypothetical protein
VDRQKAATVPPVPLRGPEGRQVGVEEGELLGAVDPILGVVPRSRSAGPRACMDGSRDARGLSGVIGGGRLRSCIRPRVRPRMTAGLGGKARIGVRSGSRAPRLSALDGLLPIPVRPVMPSRCWFTLACRETA